jgi:hypothetical protein
MKIAQPVKHKVGTPFLALVQGEQWAQDRVLFLLRRSRKRNRRAKHR